MPGNSRKRWKAWKRSLDFASLFSGLEGGLAEVELGEGVGDWPSLSCIPLLDPSAGREGEKVTSK